MAMDLYSYDESISDFVKHSQGGLLTNPAQSVHDGTNGETVEQKLYLRNDDSNFYYSNLVLQWLPLQKTAVDDINYPEAFITAKIIIQNEQPTENQWKSVASGSQEDFPDIGEVGTGDTGYKPFWILVSIPAGTRVQNINDVFPYLEGEVNPI